MDREEILIEEEQQNRRKGITISTVLHILLILLALLPLLTFPDPPPGQAGILVNLGLPDVGEGSENAGPSVPTTPQEEVSEPAQEDPTPPQEEATPPPTQQEEVKQQREEVVTAPDPDQIALQKEKDAQEAKRKAEADAKAKADAEAKRKADAEAKRKAEEEAKRKAAEEAARRKQEEANKFKDQIGGLFGDGDGKGNTGKPGNQGDPDGDPDASRVEGISTGSGTVEGLGGRSAVNAPKITENSQKQGTVVVRICVDESGKVTSADFTQKGSTTSDNRLKELAVSNARKWRFSAGSVDRQCGTITYRFRVQ